MTDSAEIEVVAKGLTKALTKAQREAVDRAGLMISGKYRIAYTYGGHVAAYALIDAKVIDLGGYLTPLGEQVRAYLQSAERER